MSREVRSLGRRHLRAGVAALVACSGALVVCSSASAFSGAFAVFDQCPVSDPAVAYCLHSETIGGEVVLGSQTTPITRPVLLQGGYTFNSETEAETFVEAANGETLTKVPQPVPGGLAGIMPPELLPEPLKKDFEEYIINGGPTGVYATLELAEPASSIQINTDNLINREGVALQLPVMVHLENPFLGSSCYIGSSSQPVTWNLTTGTTAPPSPNEPISGKLGKAGLLEEAIATLTGNRLVDNAFSAPEASGCGGLLSLLVDPVIDLKIGLPSAAGHNTAILNNEVEQAYVGAVEEH